MTTSSRAPDAEATFRQLYEDSYADVLRFVRRRVGADAAADHAEDIVAEAFLVVWRRFAELPADPSAARAWLFGVARGVLLNQRRGRSRREALGVRLASVSDREDVASEQDLVHARLDLARAWTRLRESQQEALVLSVFESLTSDQAASVLGISPVAFRLRLSKARKALRAHLQYDDATELLAAEVALTEGRAS